MASMSNFVCKEKTITCQFLAEVDILPENDFQPIFWRICEYLPIKHSILSKIFRSADFWQSFLLYLYQSPLE